MDFENGACANQAASLIEADVTPDREDISIQVGEEPLQ
jgi:hypothetical protein